MSGPIVKPSRHARDFQGLTVEIRGKVWTISLIELHPADHSVGLDRYAESFELTDESGTKWNWEHDLTEAEFEKVDTIILAAEDARIAALHPNTEEL